jgi:hypothetical protein
MYMTLGNLELNPQAGLLFIDWEHGTTLHLTGHARRDGQVVDFDVEHVIQIDSGMPLTWTFLGYSKFNPA